LLQQSARNSNLNTSLKLNRAGWTDKKDETFEKCSILPAQLNPYLIFNRGSSSRKTKILTTPVRSAGPTGQAGIHLVFRGLKSEYDEEIGQKGTFCKGRRMVFQRVNISPTVSLSLGERELLMTPPHKWMGH
jgi:hypothetical protein